MWCESFAQERESGFGDVWRAVLLERVNAKQSNLRNPPATLRGEFRGSPWRPWLGGGGLKCGEVSMPRQSLLKEQERKLGQYLSSAVDFPCLLVLRS